MKKAIVRFANQTDAPNLIKIYEPYVKNTSVTFEYTVPSVFEFENRIQTITQQFPYLVCEIDGEPVGYAYLSPHYERAAFQWDVEVSVYLSENYHHFGIATAFYECLIALAIKQGYYNLYALISIPNEKSVCFHQKMGFESVGIYPHTGYKLNSWHDLMIMEKSLIPVQNNSIPLQTKSIHQLDQSFVNSALQKCGDNIIQKLNKYEKRYS